MPGIDNNSRRSDIKEIEKVFQPAQPHLKDLVPRGVASDLWENLRLDTDSG